LNGIESIFIFFTYNLGVVWCILYFVGWDVVVFVVFWRKVSNGKNIKQISGAERKLFDYPRDVFYQASE
jgi:hypothetical protein